MPYRMASGDLSCMMSSMTEMETFQNRIRSGMDILVAVSRFAAEELTTSIVLHRGCYSKLSL